jgi:hypothetical protein
MDAFPEQEKRRVRCRTALRVDHAAALEGVVAVDELPRPRPEAVVKQQLGGAGEVPAGGLDGGAAAKLSHSEVVPALGEADQLCFKLTREHCYTRAMCED